MTATKTSTVFYNAVLFADQAVFGRLLQELQIAIEVGRGGIGELHVHDSHVLTRQKFSNLLFRDAVHFHEKGGWNSAAQQAIHPPADSYVVADSARKRVPVCYLEDQDSTGLENPDELEKIAADIPLPHVLEGDAGVNESESIVSEDMEVICLVHQKLAAGVVRVKLRR